MVVLKYCMANYIDISLKHTKYLCTVSLALINYTEEALCNLNLTNSSFILV